MVLPVMGFMQEKDFRCTRLKLQGYQHFLINMFIIERKKKEKETRHLEAQTYPLVRETALSVTIIFS